ncbi:MAG: RNA methyltransferase [Gemmatimonadota bacterium]|nr:RNA methyltransferase [Gemmatimonadota bacterium]MDH3368736.1 RNA methyltransferase [Gemmatimonadota bacterium]MDH3477435.1 RNA methyltransferase [Gemmatimonadota bacterium]MDH3569562.1 RNA methyltransferase [Gemmatimonadota bacterium]MDH5549073.1 RNA methyltransferase [Gemmatimonadota bacterium]
MASNLVSQIRNLQRRKVRRRRGLAIAEGVRLVEEAVAAGVPFRGAVVSPDIRDTARGAALVELLASHAVPIEEVGNRELAKLADTDTPQGIVAVIDPPTWTLSQIAPDPRHPVLVLDGVQDPGNVGTLLRTAFALGSPGAILLPGTADPWNPKVLRGAMGATFRFPFTSAADGEFAAWVTAHGVTLWVASVEGKALQRARTVGPLAVVVGNEGAGVRESVRSLAHQMVAIPLARGVESLNVAVAAGILLYEVTRGD